MTLTFKVTLSKKEEFSNLAEQNIQNVNKIHLILKIYWHKTLFLVYLKDIVGSIPKIYFFSLRLKQS